MVQKKEIANRIFLRARLMGKCKTQKEFCELLGLNQSTVSKALQGDERYLTDNLLRRLQLWEEQVLGKEETQPKEQAQPTRPDIVIPAETADLYNNMSETIRIQAEVIARLQAGLGAAVAAGAPKNFYLDPK